MSLMGYRGHVIPVQTIVEMYMKTYSHIHTFCLLVCVGPVNLIRIVYVTRMYLLCLQEFERIHHILRTLLDRKQRLLGNLHTNPYQR